MQSAPQTSNSNAEWDKFLGSALGLPESRELANHDCLLKKFDNRCPRMEEGLDFSLIDISMLNLIDGDSQFNQSVSSGSNYTQNPPGHHFVSTTQFDHEKNDTITALMHVNSQQSSSYSNYEGIYIENSYNDYQMATDQCYLYTTPYPTNSMCNNQQQQQQNSFSNCHGNYSQNLYPHYQQPTNGYYQQSNSQVLSGIDDNDPMYALDFTLGCSEVAPSNPNTQIDFNFEEELSELLASVSKSNPEPVNEKYINTNEWLVASATDGKTRRPFLHEFLRIMLDNPKYSHIAEYIDRKRGIFKFRQRNEAAKLWQQVKGRNSDQSMTYDKLARAIRFYYPNGVMRQSPGRFTFRFGSESGFGKTWLPA